MKRNLKKPIAVLVAAATAISLLAGCGSKTGAAPGAGETKETAKTGESSSNAEAGGEVSYPLTKGGELTYWLQLNPNASANFTNLGETELGKALQEQTGVTIKFQHPAAGADQAKEQFNLIVADGNLPDIMEWQWVKMYPGGPEKAIKDGVIIPLNDVFDMYCPNLKKYLAENPDVDKMIKTDDGHYFAFPFIRGEDKLRYTVGGFIRQDWLEELGLEVPTTIDEWHTVLTAFKEKKGAEAPISFDWTNFKQSNPFAFAYHVGAANSTWFIIDDEGKIAFAPAQDGYKDYLMTMNQWYQEGLIDKDIATLNGDQVTAKMTSDKSGVSVGWAASRMQLFMTSVQKSNPDYLLVPTPTPTLEKGAAPEYGYMENKFPDVGAAITTSCKNVELAARLLDYGYSEAGHNLFNYGVEGVSYEMKDGKAVYTDLVMNNPDGWPLAQSLSKYVRANYNGPFVQDLNYLEQYLQLPTVKDCPQVWEVANANKHTVPNITPTQEESKELATITNELTTYIDEMTLKFIFGTESFDKWDNYIQTLKDMKLDRALEIENAALERYEAR
ncbi:extracellular solute-binding protein [Lacrimispora sphenoides]|uniref:Aldouronate transport system substrate-binding protein n=1 Tax=Lacrimispora sphenoides JCM 1415 TaxID=1297793 RepID=A0ABY1CJ86_9FIRM|nr:extracellular solute-binding protein [Lacrimispora sphenoides]SEU07963.1 putative aldouronate transport system substrate-binding protein [[Clostridium] sphenoides JCM 1415]SUY49293.1 extracellular solute-binding protein, family 1 [Lacrimispora sphenoides]